MKAVFVVDLMTKMSRAGLLVASRQFDVSKYF